MGQVLHGSARTTAAKRLLTDAVLAAQLRRPEACLRDSFRTPIICSSL